MDAAAEVTLEVVKVQAAAAVVVVETEYNGWVTSEGLMWKNVDKRDTDELADRKLRDE